LALYHTVEIGSQEISISSWLRRQASSPAILRTRLFRRWRFAMARRTSGADPQITAKSM